MCLYHRLFSSTSCLYTLLLPTWFLVKIKILKDPLSWQKFFLVCLTQYGGIACFDRIKKLHVYLFALGLHHCLGGLPTQLSKFKFFFFFFSFCLFFFACKILLRCVAFRVKSKRATWKLNRWAFLFFCFYYLFFLHREMSF